MICKDGNPKDYWTKDKVIEEAKKYTTLKEFTKKSRRAYINALNGGYLNELDWLKRDIEPKSYWTKELVVEESKKYETQSEFRKGSAVAYKVAVENDWLKEFTWLDVKRIYRTFEEVEAVAKKYTNKTDFYKEDKNTYVIAKKRGYLEKFTWLEDKTKPKGYWTYENLEKESRKYTTFDDFHTGSPSAYATALKHNYLDKFTWLGYKGKPKGYWTKERLELESRKYTSKLDFKKNNPQAYNAAYSKGYLEDFTWLVPLVKPKNYWTKERVFEESKKYNKRHDFKLGNNSAYSVARKNGFLDEMTWLVDSRVDLITDKIDSVYAYEFVDQNAVYIGRTLMRLQKDRDYQHIFSEKDTVARYAKEKNVSVPKMKILEENLTIKEGSTREGDWVEIYKKKGWTILNIAATGSIGSIGKGKWTKAKCTEIAKKYTTVKEFRANDLQAYNASIEKGFLSEFTWLEKKEVKPRDYWTKEHVIEESKKYKTRGEFMKNSKVPYMVSLDNKWLDEFTWLSKKPSRPKGYWKNKENIRLEAKKYKSKAEFLEKCRSGYDAACKNKMLNELFPKDK